MKIIMPINPTVGDMVIVEDKLFRFGESSKLAINVPVADTAAKSLFNLETTMLEYEVPYNAIGEGFFTSSQNKILNTPEIGIVELLRSFKEDEWNYIPVGFLEEVEDLITDASFGWKYNDLCK